jgi:hypothetical protein
MGAHLAALLNSEYASGLGTAALLTQDVTDTPLMSVDGEIAVGRVSILNEEVQKLEASAETSSWWQQRLGVSLSNF